MIGFSPSLSVEHASASMPLANAESGLVPIVHATGMPSWQSITGDGQALPAGMENSVRSVTHGMFGRSAWKSPSARFAGALVSSPLYEPCRFALLDRGTRPCLVMSPMICFALATIPMPLSSRWTRLYPYLRLLFSNASRTSSSRPESFVFVQ
ncbi:hypothetical protein BBRI4_12c308 [Bifidobacterium breve]|nr:hypothetical protein BBRI4_12c308 [Bifidobacterium breve]